MQFSYGELCFHAASLNLACLKEESQCRLLPIKISFCIKKSLVSRLNILELVSRRFRRDSGLQANCILLRILLGGMLWARRKEYFIMELIPQIWLILESRNLRSAFLIDGILFDKVKNFSMLDSNVLIFFMEWKKCEAIFLLSKNAKRYFFRGGYFLGK